MYNVLIVIFLPYKAEIANFFKDSGYNVEMSESAFDAMARLKISNFDLIISDVELPGDNAFDLYNYINTHYPYIPTIMITENHFDSFFDRIFHEGIGNVLNIPIDKEEILNLAEKLITRKNIFGLNNYMNDIEEIKKIKITSSGKIQESINKIQDQIEDWGFKIKNRVILNLVLNEMIINAVYHSHGYTAEKEERLHVDLKADEYVDVFFARNEYSYGISINDYMGKLTKMQILDSLHTAIKQTQLILKAAETGEEITDEITETGRGLDMLRKIAGDYYFIIDKDERTEIIILFYDQSFGSKDKSSSLKIIETK